MSLEGLIGGWKEVRSGLIDEAEQIPADKFSFQAAPNTRSVAQLLQHLIEAQKFLVGEVSRPDTNLLPQPFADHIKHYAQGWLAESAARQHERRGDAVDRRR